MSELEQPNIRVEKVHISQIKSGDVILHEGILSTITNTNIKYCSFMGISIFGDTYNLGYKSVIKIHFIVPSIKTPFTYIGETWKKLSDI